MFRLAVHVSGCSRAARTDVADCEEAAATCERHAALLVASMLLLSADTHPCTTGQSLQAAG